MCLMCQTSKKDPSKRASKCLYRQSYGETLAKEAFWSPATRGLKKNSDGAITPAVETIRVPEHLVPPGSPLAKQLCHLHVQLSLEQSCHRQKKKSLASMHTGLLQWCPTLYNPVDCGLPNFSVRGFSRQEYWSILPNTGCHILLEHYISCCPSHQLPWVPGAARTPETQAAAPPPHSAFTVANPYPPGHPQEQTPVNDSHAEVENKSQLKPRASVAKAEDSKPSHQLCKL